MQFLYDRLPLYIVAMYPFFSYAAWALVQRTGIFQALQHALVGASCVTVVFFALYEVIDMVGPSVPLVGVERDTCRPPVPKPLGHVPYVNLQAFSVALPFAMALATLLVCKQGRVRARIVARNVLAVCLLVWPILFLSSLPSLLMVLTGVSVETSRIVATWLMVGAVGVVTAVAFVRAYRARRDDPAHIPAGVGRDYFGLVLVGCYLAVAAMCWIAALPDYFSAKEGFALSGAGQDRCRSPS